MKTLVSILCTLLISICVSCSTTHKFPVSQITPAAEIKAKANTDKYKNHTFEVHTKFLTDPSRLTPPKKVYVVWVNTKNNGVMNLGQLQSRTQDIAILRTLTPFEPVELFITAEDKALIREPEGIEISRIKL